MMTDDGLRFNSHIARGKQIQMTTNETPFTSPFNALSTASEVAEDIDFTGKTVLITGGTLGIGYDTAKVLAAKGAHVIITGRSAMIAESGNGNVEFLTLDLGSLQSVRDFAAIINARDLAIDVLINNAGIGFIPYSLTEDGYERNFAVNHLGPSLKRSSNAGNQVRVVNLSSGAHLFSKDTTFSDYNYENREYQQLPAYGETKLANIYHVIALNARLQNAGIGSAFAVHPGSVYTEGAAQIETVLTF